MELVERYLATVRVLLPVSERDDITAELREALLTLREEREAELGHPLTQAEAEGLLRDIGHPVIVAARYRRQQYLVGPELYPAYIFVLTLVLAIVAASALLVGIVAAVASSGAAGFAVGKAIAIAWNGAFVAVGAVTVIFAGLQRYSPRLNFLNHWRARDLPRIRKPRPVTWIEHVGGIVVGVLFILWWTGTIPLPPLIPLEAGQSLHLQLAPIWQRLYWPVLGLALGMICIHGLRLVRQTSQRVGNALELALQLGLLVLSAAALRAGPWVIVTGTGLPTQAIANVERGVNIGLEVALIVTVCAAAISASYNLWRLSRRQVVRE